MGTRRLEVFLGRPGVEGNDKTCDTTMHLFLCLFFLICFIPSILLVGFIIIISWLLAGTILPFFAVNWTITRHRTLEKRKVFWSRVSDHLGGGRIVTEIYDGGRVVHGLHVA